jgi:uncharacterized protein
MTLLTQEQIKPFVMVAHGDLAAVKEMLAAEPALLDACFEQFNERPIQAAAHTGSREIAEFLLDNGAPLDIFAAAALGMTDKVAAFLADDPSLASANGVHGISILYHAAMSGKVEIADLLKAHGGGQNAGHALHGAVLFGHREMAQWLLDNGADVNAPNMMSKTPLDTALAKGYTEIADLLRQHGGQETAVTP